MTGRYPPPDQRAKQPLSISSRMGPLLFLLLGGCGQDERGALSGEAPQDSESEGGVPENTQPNGSKGRARTSQPSETGKTEPSWIAPQDLGPLRLQDAWEHVFLREDTEVMSFHRAYDVALDLPCSVVELHAPNGDFTHVCMPVTHGDLLSGDACETPALSLKSGECSGASGPPAEGTVVRTEHAIDYVAGRPVEFDELTGCEHDYSYEYSAPAEALPIDYSLYVQGTLEIVELDQERGLETTVFRGHEGSTLALDIRRHGKACSLVETQEGVLCLPARPKRLASFEYSDPECNDHTIFRLGGDDLPEFVIDPDAPYPPRVEDIHYTGAQVDAPPAFIDGACVDNPVQGSGISWHEVGSSLNSSDFPLLEPEFRGPYRLKKPTIEMRGFTIPVSYKLWDSKYEVSCTAEGNVCAPRFPDDNWHEDEPEDEWAELFSDEDCTSPVFESSLDADRDLFTSLVDDFCFLYEASYRAARYDGPVFRLDNDECILVESTSDRNFYSWWTKLTDLAPLL